MLRGRVGTHQHPVPARGMWETLQLQEALRGIAHGLPSNPQTTTGWQFPQGSFQYLRFNTNTVHFHGTSRRRAFDHQSRMAIFQGFAFKS